MESTALPWTISLSSPLRWQSFNARLAKEMGAAGTAGQALALILVEIRQFFLHNYKFGFAAGEQVMSHSLTRLQHCMPKATVIERIAPGRIGLIVPDVAVPELLPIAAERIGRAMADPFATGDREITISPAVGVAVFPDHGTRPEALLSEAELALTEAERSASAYHIASRADSEAHLAAWHLERDLLRALRDDELELYYQPQVCLKNGCVSGAETLMRWTTADSQRVDPNQFIPIAEASGAIHDLTEWAVNTALREMSGLLTRHPALSVAVNVSASSIYDHGLVRLVESALAIWDVPPACLVIEVTESSLMKNPDLCFRNLTWLRDLGVGIAIDDFGTGFSSLSYFKAIPADKIKIDQSFVRNMLHDPVDARLVRTIIDLAHNFGLTLVAEGVEDRETLKRLQEMDCDLVQGFHLSHPLDLQAYRQWLEHFDPTELAPR